MFKHTPEVNSLVGLQELSREFFPSRFRARTPKPTSLWAEGEGAAIQAPFSAQCSELPKAGFVLRLGTRIPQSSRARVGTPPYISHRSKALPPAYGYMQVFKGFRPILLAKSPSFSKAPLSKRRPKPELKRGREIRSNRVCSTLVTPHVRSGYIIGLQTAGTEVLREKSDPRTASWARASR